MPRRLLSLLPLLGTESLVASAVEVEVKVAAVLDCRLWGTDCPKDEGGSSGKAPGIEAGEEKASDDRGDFWRWMGFRDGVIGRGRRSFGGTGGCCEGGGAVPDESELAGRGLAGRGLAGRGLAGLTAPI